MTFICHSRSRLYPDCYLRTSDLSKLIEINVDDPQSKYICIHCANHNAYKSGVQINNEISNNLLSYFTLFKDAPPQNIIWTFIRGFIDKNIVTFDFKTSKIVITINKRHVSLFHEVMNFSGNIPFSKCERTDEDTNFSLDGTNAIDFLGQVYENSTVDTRIKTNYDNFIQFTTLSYPNSICRCDPTVEIRFPQFLVCKTDDKAHIPTKAKFSDVGYDLTIIKSTNKKLASNCFLYDTGIRIAPEHGYYAEIVPRSSLSKSGYMLANSIGIVDPSYRGNLYVALIKIDPEAADITFPFRCCQLIFRKSYHLEAAVVQDLNTTERGDGGFGSTGI